MMNNKHLDDDIFTKKLNIIEIIKKTFKVFAFFGKDMLISFMIFFIPVLILVIIGFRSDLYSIENTNEVIPYLGLILSFTQTLFSAALILYIVGYFEKKLIFTKKFLQLIFLKIISFIIVFFPIIFITLLGRFVFVKIFGENISIFIVYIPEIFIGAALYFTYFIIFLENRWGLDSILESIRTFKIFWCWVILFFAFLVYLNHFVIIGIDAFINLFHFPRIELKYFVSFSLTIFIVTIIEFFYVLFFYNLRQLIKPKDKIEKPLPY